MQEQDVLLQKTLNLLTGLPRVQGVAVASGQQLDGLLMEWQGLLQKQNAVAKKEVSQDAVKKVSKKKK